MTTPSVNTPFSIICDARRDAGLARVGDVPSGEILAESMRRLNDMINFWMTQGCKLWLSTDHEVTLVSGTVSYTILVGDVRAVRVDQGYYLDSLDNSRPIYPLSYQEWLTLSNRTDTGPVTQFFADKRTSSLVVSFWLVPDATAATGTAHLLVRRQIVNPISLTETMELPPEWRIAARWGLADEICTGQPKEIMDRCAGRAQMYRNALEAWDVEDASVTFQVDSRAAMPSSFR